MADKINPPHYKVTIKNAQGQSMQVEAADIIEAFFAQDAHLAQAFKYMARAGKKPRTSYVEDVKKSQWWLERSIEFHTGRTEPRRRRRSRSLPA